jgi:hypothetical protein
MRKSTLRRTNAIENLNALVGHFVRNVRRWRNGRMLILWVAAGLRGYAELPPAARSS